MIVRIFGYDFADIAAIGISALSGERKGAFRLQLHVWYSSLERARSLSGP